MIWKIIWIVIIVLWVISLFSWWQSSNTPQKPKDTKWKEKERIPYEIAFEKHKKKLFQSSYNFYGNGYLVENTAVDCWKDIMGYVVWYREYYSNIIHNSNYSQEDRELLEKIYKEYRTIYYNWQEEKKRLKEEKDELDFQNLIYDNQELIDKFLQIAYRKISLKDDYWDENWEALPKEIAILMGKLEKNNKIDYSVSSKIKQYLEDKYKKYHIERGNSRIHISNDMSWIDFENELWRALTKKGYTVSNTPTTWDQWADLIISKWWKTIAIQAKRYSKNVWNKAVQEVIWAIKYYNANEWWVITNSTFTDSAKKLAQANGIKLYDKFNIWDIIR